jgi:hypothetical protein
MKYIKLNKVSKILLLAVSMFFVFTMQANSQNVTVNDNEVSTSNENSTNVIILEGNSTDNQSTEKKSSENKEVVKETAKFSQEELTGGNWVLSGVEAKNISGVNITKWQSNNNELKGNCSWKDVLDIIHTVESGFKWQDPPKNMQPGSYLNLEAIYTNLDYSTTAPINTGIKMFFASTKADVKVMGPDALEVLKLNKDNKQYANEVKKGFFYAPITYFDETNKCQLVVDCYVGKDHYVTTYTYVYQQ